MYDDVFKLFFNSHAYTTICMHFCGKQKQEDLNFVVVLGDFLGLNFADAVSER